ncbi:MAG: purine-nucleoside phosphorylase, partial [Aquiluna sp.]
MVHPLNVEGVDPFEFAQRAADQIAQKTSVEHHDIALTLGSGWSKAADLIGETIAEIPA